MHRAARNTFLLSSFLLVSTLLGSAARADVGASATRLSMPAAQRMSRAAAAETKKSPVHAGPILAGEQQKRQRAESLLPVP